jgi:hypothetical protein
MRCITLPPSAAKRAGALALLATLATTLPAAAATLAQSGIPTDAKPDAPLATLLEAMRAGDDTAAMRIYRTTTDPATHVVAAMVVERIHFNLDAASADARLCEDNLLDSRPGIALLCGQFLSGDLRLAGHFKQARDLEAALVQRYRRHGVDRQLDGMRAYLAHTADTPQPEITQPSSDVILPYKEIPRQGQARPIVAAEAHGHAFDLLIDTGASYMALGQDQARRLGIRMLSGKGRTNGVLSKGVPVQYGVLDELHVGPMVLRNVPVEVKPTPNALIGADLIAAWGSMRFGPSSVRIYGAHSTDIPACGDPMLAGTDVWGDGLRLHPRLLINGKLRSVTLDTGDYMYLTGSQSALGNATVLHRGKLPLRDIGGTHPFASDRVAKVELVIAGQPIRMYFPIYPDSSLPWPFLLGAGALRDMDFLLDFRHQRQCFLLHPDLH